MNAKSEIAARYAEALMESAEEAGRVEDISRDIRCLLEILESDASIGGFIRSRTIADARKLEVLENSLIPSFDTLVGNLIRLMARNGRIALLAELCSEFSVVLDGRRKITQARLVSACGLSNADMDELGRRLEARFNRKFRIKFSSVPDLIAGFKFYFDDVLFDCSASGRMEALRRSLAT